MKAKKLFKQRVIIGKEAFVELILWELPDPVRGSCHYYKYRLAFIVKGECVLRYDNEKGKGDHKHLSEIEQKYSFQNIESMVDDFYKDIKRWQDEHNNT